MRRSMTRKAVTLALFMALSGGRAHAQVGGDHHVLVLLVNFQDDTSEPITPADARTTFFDGSNSMSAFYAEASYGLLSLSGDVRGWYTLSMNCPLTNYDSAVLDAAVQMADPDVSFPSYQHLILYSPYVSGCSTRPHSVTVTLNTADGPVTLTVAYVFSGYSPGTSWHELGHGLGLVHGGSLTCANGVVDSSCSELEYGDSIDVMGGGFYSGHPSAYHKEKLGGLAPLAVRGNGAFQLDALETPSTGVQALKILRSTSGANTTYY